MALASAFWLMQILIWMWCAVCAICSLLLMSAGKARLQGLPDPEVLAIAAREKRLLLTHDKRTMPRHFTDFLAHGAHSPGVFLLPQEGIIKASIEALNLILGSEHT